VNGLRVTITITTAIQNYRIWSFRGISSNSVKFRGNMEIPRQRPNSAARLEIPRPAENCGPYWWVTTPAAQTDQWHVGRPGHSHWYWRTGQRSRSMLPCSRLLNPTFLFLHFIFGTFLYPKHLGSYGFNHDDDFQSHQERWVLTSLLTFLYMSAVSTASHEVTGYSSSTGTQITSTRFTIRMSGEVTNSMVVLFSGRR